MEIFFKILCFSKFIDKYKVNILKAIDLVTVEIKTLS